MVAVKLTTSARGLSRDGRTSARAQEAHVTSCQTRHEPVREQSVVNGPMQVTAYAEEILDDTVQLLQQASGYAAERNIDVLIEVHPFTLGINLDFAVLLCDRIDMPNFGIAYDSCHFAVGLPDGYVDAIRALDHRIKHVHFSDSDKRSSELHFPPGRGCLDMDAIVQALHPQEAAGPSCRPATPRRTTP